MCWWYSQSHGMNNWFNPTLMKTLDSPGPRMDPWGIQPVTDLHLGAEPYIAPFWMLPSSQFLIHQIVTESQNGLGSGDVRDHLVPSPVAQARTPITRPGCWEPRPIWTDISRDGAFTAALGNLSLCLTTITVNFFLISNLDLPSFSLKHCSITVCLSSSLIGFF